MFHAIAMFSAADVFSFDWGGLLDTLRYGSVHVMDSYGGIIF
ncbi:MAG: hypothetical protein NVSMB19_22850 [Vulcanimicrobiaceae bacterium]